MGVADAGHDGGNGAVRAIEFLAALGIVPGQGRKAALNGGNGVRLGAARRRANGTAGCGANGTGGDVEPDDLRIGRQRRNILAPAPGGEMFPVRGIGAAGVLGAGGLDIEAGAIGQRFEMRGQGRRCLGRRLRPGTIKGNCRAVGRRSDFGGCVFGVLLDDLDVLLGLSTDDI
jgi:hypothetical protein